jgi:hypothetical protein
VSATVMYCGAQILSNMSEKYMLVFEPIGEATANLPLGPMVEHGPDKRRVESSSNTQTGFRVLISYLYVVERATQGTCANPGNGRIDDLSKRGNKFPYGSDRSHNRLYFLLHQ